jgi:hypothetical protein
VKLVQMIFLMMNLMKKAYSLLTSCFSKEQNTKDDLS